ncbi:MAG TPA: glycosyltransferase family 4 protein [Phycisphaerae bacterium]|nr:glycosyltransferase family 4 protein [Phycisphaerae bacterium]
MKVFMLGWEFPPYISGGLGTACYGLTRGLDEAGVEVTFVLPTAVPLDAASHVHFRTPATLMGDLPAGTVLTAEGFQRLTVRALPAMLQAYATAGGFEQMIEQLRQQQNLGALGIPGLTALAGGGGGGGGRSFVGGSPGMYRGDLLTQIQYYASLAVELAKREQFDLVHAHDWMTYPAGLAVSAYTGKPLVVHLHSTEFDRSGEHVNQQVYDIERAGMHGADRVICVSYLTRGIALRRYGVPAEKIEVVYNAVEHPDGGMGEPPPIARDEKIVLFLGRITMQKGPEYFLHAAKKVLEKFKKVRFVIAGSGDMTGQIVELSAALGIGRHVTFTGFLRGDDVARVFRMADLYVMPSVSEPFGIAPLEALSHNVPVIISKQSGVSEVLTHVLKVDFWDVDEMANKIIAVLRHPPLQRVLRQQGQIELRRLSWRDSAEKCKEVYQQLVGVA